VLIVAFTEDAAYLNSFSQPFAAGFVMQRERPTCCVAFFVDASENVCHALGLYELRVHGSRQDFYSPSLDERDGCCQHNEHDEMTTTACSFDVQLLAKQIVTVVQIE
jgi:hypothetical protein